MELIYLHAIHHFEGDLSWKTLLFWKNLCTTGFSLESLWIIVFHQSSVSSELLQEMSFFNFKTNSAFFLFFLKLTSEVSFQPELEEQLKVLPWNKVATVHQMVIWNLYSTSNSGARFLQGVRNPFLKKSKEEDFEGTFCNEATKFSLILLEKKHQVLVLFESVPLREIFEKIETWFKILQRVRFWLMNYNVPYYLPKFSQQARFEVKCFCLSQYCDPTQSHQMCFKFFSESIWATETYVIFLKQIKAFAVQTLFLVLRFTGFLTLEFAPVSQFYCSFNLVCERTKNVY